MGKSRIGRLTAFIIIMAMMLSLCTPFTFAAEGTGYGNVRFKSDKGAVLTEVDTGETFLINAIVSYSNPDNSELDTRLYIGEDIKVKNDTDVDTIIYNSASVTLDSTTVDVQTNPIPQQPNTPMLSIGKSVVGLAEDNILTTSTTTQSAGYTAAMNVNAQMENVTKGGGFSISTVRLEDIQIK